MLRYYVPRQKVKKKLETLWFAILVDFSWNFEKWRQEILSIQFTYNEFPIKYTCSLLCTLVVTHDGASSFAKRQARRANIAFPHSWTSGHSVSLDSFPAAWRVSSLSLWSLLFRHIPYFTSIAFSKKSSPTPAITVRHICLCQKLIC